MFLRSSKSGGRSYWRVVESYREDGKPKHRTIHNLGAHETREKAQAAWDALGDDEPCWEELKAEAERLRADAAERRRQAEHMKAATDFAAAGSTDWVGDWMKNRRAKYEAGEWVGDGLDEAFWDHQDLINDRLGRPRRPRPGGRTSSYPSSFGAAVDWRAVLGLSFDATLDQVKAVYRRKAAEAHPDRGGSHEAMTKLNEAYEAAKQAFGA